jgi:hypothetical protein
VVSGHAEKDQAKLMKHEKPTEDRVSDALDYLIELVFWVIRRLFSLGLERVNV